MISNVITENLKEKTNEILCRFEVRLANLVPKITLLETDTAALEPPDSKKRKRYVRPYWTKDEHPELPKNVFFRNKLFRWKKSKKGILVECQEGFKTIDAACEALQVYNDTGQDVSAFTKVYASSGVKPEVVA